jgi:hypothetical protein
MVGMLRRLAVIFVLSLCGWTQTLPGVPDNLKPPAGESLLRQVQATGDQVYTCDGTSWTLSRPDAKLLDESGKHIGSHFAGPTWQWNDGSRVVGRAVANTRPDPDSIPWLLLTAIDHKGDGILKNVTTIQRLSTKGGNAPGSGCDAAHKGQEYRSHYTAVYYFYQRP